MQQGERGISLTNPCPHMRLEGGKKNWTHFPTTFVRKAMAFWLMLGLYHPSYIFLNLDSNNFAMISFLLICLPFIC